MLDNFVLGGLEINPLTPEKINLIVDRYKKSIDANPEALRNFLETWGEVSGNWDESPNERNRKFEVNFSKINIDDEVFKKDSAYFASILKVKIWKIGIANVDYCDLYLGENGFLYTEYGGFCEFSSMENFILSTAYNDISFISKKIPLSDVAALPAKELSKKEKMKENLRDFRFLLLGK